MKNRMIFEEKIDSLFITVALSARRRSQDKSLFLNAVFFRMISFIREYNRFRQIMTRKLFGLL